MLRSLAELEKEKTFKKERAFPYTSFRKKKLLNSKRESTRSNYMCGHTIHFEASVVDASNEIIKPPAWMWREAVG